MEADWSAEIGDGLPVLVIPWEGFIDLRHAPSQVESLAETAENMALRMALLRLNAADSPVVTSKCDIWSLSGDEIDPFEFEAAEVNAQTGIACYMDVLPQEPSLFPSFAGHEQWVRRATAELHRAAVHQARADFVIRAADVDGRDGFGVTLYVVACGADRDAAVDIFHSALEAATAITIKTAFLAGE